MSEANENQPPIDSKQERSGVRDYHTYMSSLFFAADLVAGGERAQKIVRALGMEESRNSELQVAKKLLANEASARAVIVQLMYGRSPSETAPDSMNAH